MHFRQLFPIMPQICHRSVRQFLQDFISWKIPYEIFHMILIIHFVHQLMYQFHHAFSPAR